MLRAEGVVVRVGAGRARVSVLTCLVYPLHTEHTDVLGVLES